MECLQQASAARSPEQRLHVSRCPRLTTVLTRSCPAAEGRSSTNVKEVAPLRPTSSSFAAVAPLSSDESTESKARSAEGGMECTHGQALPAAISPQPSPPPRTSACAGHALLCQATPRVRCP